MQSRSVPLQVTLVVVWIVAVVLGAVFVGVRPDGLAAELTAEALASDEARVEVSELMAKRLTEEAPLLEAVGDLDGLILDAINSRTLERALPIWAEHAVRYRMGQDVGPLAVRPRDVVETDSAILNAGIAALPSIPVTLRSKGTDVLVPALKIAAPIAVVVGVALIGLLSRRCGWRRVMQLVGLASLLAAAALLGARLAATLDGELSSIVASRVISVWVVAAVAALAVLILAVEAAASMTARP